MKTLKILGIAFFAALVLAALAAADASAAELEWLVNGESVVEALNSELEGEIEFVSYEKADELTKVLTRLLCSVIFNMTLGPLDDVDFISALNLAKEATGKDQLTGETTNTLEGKPLLCNVTKDGGSLTSCKEGENAAEVWFSNMPWDYVLVLLGIPGVFGGVRRRTPEGEKEPGWEIECTSLIGVKGADLCEADPLGGPEAFAEDNVETSPPSVLITFHEMEDNELANCSLTGELTGDMISEGEGKVSSDQWAIGAELERLTTALSNET